jgi:hypothetical protein
LARTGSIGDKEARRRFGVFMSRWAIGGERPAKSEESTREGDKSTMENKRNKWEGERRRQREGGARVGKHTMEVGEAAGHVLG